MNLKATDLYIQISQLPASFSGGPNDLAVAMVKRMRIVSPNGTNFIFVGDTEPTSNVGPWLKGGTKWYVWDPSTKRYVPLDISDSMTIPFHIGTTTPTDSTPPVWLRTTKDATDTDPTYGNPIGWYVFNGTEWVPYISIVMSGPTASRPSNAVEFQMYYDTDITCLIWWERAKWRTVDGVPGDCKFVAFETLEAALTQNPGWNVLGSNNQAYRGRIPMQAAKDAGSNPDTVLTVDSGVPQRGAFETFGETDKVQLNAGSTVPYPPQIALWMLVKE